MGFWGEIGRQCGGRLKSLRVELEADVLPGVLDITDCLPALMVSEFLAPPTAYRH